MDQQGCLSRENCPSQVYDRPAERIFARLRGTVPVAASLFVCACKHTSYLVCLYIVSMRMCVPGLHCSTQKFKYKKAHSMAPVVWVCMNVRLHLDSTRSGIIGMSGHGGCDLQERWMEPGRRSSSVRCNTHMMCVL